MRTFCCILAILPVLILGLAGRAWPQDRPWRPLMEAGQWDPGTKTWLGAGTHSQRTPEGLLVADTSSETGSGRFYMLDWQADPAKGAAVEARVKVVSCSAPSGVSLMVADGIHEEALTLYPDRLRLNNAGATVDFDAASDFHTYRIEIQGEDVRLFVDGKLLVDGAGRFTSPAQANPPRNQCGFGCGASAAQGEAVWQWVRYQSDKPVEELPRYEVPGLRLTRSETIEIIPGAIYAGLFKFRDGRLAVGGRHSADGGKTWTPGPGLGPGAFEFPDGEIISPGFNTKKVADGVFEVPLSRSTDGGRTFVAEKARLNIPEGAGGTGDDGKYYEGPPVDHAVIQLRDGSLLMAMYGHFKTDTVLCPAFPPEWKVYKYRTWVMRSTDRGRTWDYWATVAYDPEIGCESFCEADLLTLPDGEILCFMRTGGSPPKYVTPLYLSRSSDDGKTWSKPVPIADRGVWPNACRMQSGILVVTYGRPDNWLAFSLDDGRTWLGSCCFYQGLTTSYNSVEEVTPGKLLVVYDRRSLDADGNQAGGVVGTFFTVERP
ncbi:MAG: exo-alpha-sialidase [Armatimonadota bacterium]